MSSILDFYKANNITFSVTSSTPESSANSASNAFSKEGKPFQTTVSPSYWRIYFSKPVKMGSYIISGQSNGGNSITSWEISYSLDGKNFVYLQTNAARTIIGNTKRFLLEKPIYCQYFKISGKTTTANTAHLYFNYFDCFRAKRQNSCNPAFFVNRLIKNELLLIMVMISSSQ